MEKKLIYAVLLSAIVIMLWQKFVVTMYPEQRRGEVSETALAPGAPDAARAPRETADLQPRKVMKPTSEPRLIEKTHTAETEQLVVIFSDIGGCIKEIALKDYKNGDGRDYYTLMSAKNAGQGIFTISSGKLDMTEDTARYEINALPDQVEYYHTSPAGIKITKRYLFTRNDSIDLEIEFENQSSQIHTFHYDVIGAVNIESAEPLSDRYVEACSKIGSTITRSRNAGKSGFKAYPGQAQWSGIVNKFFAIVLKPANASTAAFLLTDADKALASGVRMAEVSISPGAKLSNTFTLYVGPKEEKRLALFELGEILNYGIFGGISNLLLALLTFFYNVTHNWGISIIMLSASVSLLLYPLTRKSLKSMQTMQTLQPKIKILQDKYKKNSQKLNKEIMQLYKDEKVNPLGGCLPMLLQMPIFIALYQGLIRFIELKNAGFLWINDLSMPDSVPIPFVDGKTVHILPLLMAGMMFFQQKFSHPQHQAGLSEQQMQQQKIMSLMMPVMFGFIFYNFPSGLVLYWFTNTLFMTCGQVLMMRKGKR